MATPDDVTALALTAAGGDRAALAEFIRRTQGDVWRFVARLADPGLADDLTQETYLRVLPALAGFEGRSSARAWVLAIAKRVVVDQFRHDGARPRLTGGAAWLALTDAWQDSCDPTGELAVEELLGLLDPDRREALVLTQLMGFSYAEAAVVAGCAVGTIRSRVSRARAELVAAVESQTLAESVR